MAWSLIKVVKKSISMSSSAFLGQLCHWLRQGLTLGTLMRRNGGQSRQRSTCAQQRLRNKKEPEIRTGSKSEQLVVRKKKWHKAQSKKIIMEISDLTWRFLHTSYLRMDQVQGISSTEGLQVKPGDYNWGRGSEATIAEDILAQPLSNSPYILS